MRAVGLQIRTSSLLPHRRLALQTKALGNVHVHTVHHLSNSNPLASVVFIPGLYQTYDEFITHTQLQKTLSVQTSTLIYSPLAYDSTGYGVIGRPGDELSLLRKAEELGDLISKLGLPAPYVLCGISLGSLYALTFAQRYPALTKGVVAIECPGDPEAISRRLGSSVPLSVSTQTLYDGFVKCEAFPSLTELVCPVIVLENCFYGLEELRRYFEMFKVEFTPRNVAVLYAYLFERHRFHLKLAKKKNVKKGYLRSYVFRNHNLHREVESDVIEAVTSLL